MPILEHAAQTQVSFTSHQRLCLLQMPTMHCCLPYPLPGYSYPSVQEMHVGGWLPVSRPQIEPFWSVCSRGVQAADITLAANDKDGQLQCSKAQIKSVEHALCHIKQVCEHCQVAKSDT